MNKKTGLGIGLLVFAVLFLGGYIIIENYNEAIAIRAQRLQQEAYTMALEDIFLTAAQCQQIPLTYNNITINLIAVECLELQNG